MCFYLPTQATVANRHNLAKAIIFTLNGGYESNGCCSPVISCKMSNPLAQQTTQIKFVRDQPYISFTVCDFYLVFLK